MPRYERIVEEDSPSTRWKFGLKRIILDAMGLPAYNFSDSQERRRNFSYDQKELKYIEINHMIAKLGWAAPMLAAFFSPQLIPVLVGLKVASGLVSGYRRERILEKTKWEDLIARRDQPPSF